MSWENTESAMVDAVYSGLGQLVTYKEVGETAVSIYSIFDDGNSLFGVASETSEALATAHVKVSDITMPGRGDLLTLASTKVYVVDSVERKNNTEWALVLTEQAR